MSQFLTDPAEIIAWLDLKHIISYEIKPDGAVDVHGTVNLDASDFEDKLIVLPVKFGAVYGSFDLDNNQLITLEGSPHTVHGTFRCCGNQLTSLRGGPRRVTGDFIIKDNPLESFDYLPDYVGDHIFCYKNLKAKNLLALFMVSGLRGIIHTQLNTELTKLAELLRQPTKLSIFEWQQELINAELEEYASL